MLRTLSLNNKVAASDAVVFVNKTNAYGKPGDFYAYTIRNLNDIKAKSGAAVAPFWTTTRLLQLMLN